MLSKYQYDMPENSKSKFLLSICLATIDVRLIRAKYKHAL